MEELRKDKKVSSDSHTGFNLWLTAFFAVPWLASAFVIIALRNYISMEYLEYVALIASLSALVPGTYYACRYINNHYIVSNKKRVIEFAVLYALMIFILFNAIAVIKTSKDLGIDVSVIMGSQAFFLSSFGFLCKIAVFFTVANSKLIQDK